MCFLTTKKTVYSSEFSKYNVLVQLIKGDIYFGNIS